MTALVHTQPSTGATDGLFTAHYAHQHASSVTSTSSSSSSSLDQHASESRPAEAGAWKRKLRHDNRHARESHASETASRASIGAREDDKAIDSSSKKHRFSLRRLFRHEEKKAEEGTTEQARRTAPLRVEIPPLFLMHEKNGGVTVSGKRVPFTRQAYRRKKKVVRPLPRIVEGRALGHVYSSKSMEEYRRRAYYPAKKAHSKK